MENEQNNKELESLAKRIRFKSLPFDEKQMSERLADRIRRPVVISYAGKGNPAWKYLSIAASIALLLLTGIILADKEPEQGLVYYETTAVPDAKTKITLPDSSVVWLNANACLRYPREFSGQARQVEIKGEAFFEVRKDEKKPFIVRTDGIGIQCRRGTGKDSGYAHHRENRAVQKHEPVPDGRPNTVTRRAGCLLQA